MKLEQIIFDDHASDELKGLMEAAANTSTSPEDIKDSFRLAFASGFQAASLEDLK